MMTYTHNYPSDISKDEAEIIRQDLEAVFTDALAKYGYVIV